MKLRYKILLSAAAVFTLIILACCVARDYWNEAFARYVGRQMYIEALDYGPFLPPVDKVDVMLLGGIQKSKEDTGFMETAISDYVILDQKTIEGKDAETIADIWRDLPQNPRYSASCHDPLYALRFLKGEKKICEVTICWHCSNIGLTVPYDLPLGDREFGFVADSKAALMLLNRLKKDVPPPATTSK